MYKHLCFLPLLGMFFFATSVFSQKKNNDDTKVFFDKKDKVTWIYHEKWCLYALGDAKGNALTIFQFDAPAHFNNNIAVVKRKGKYHFINKTGQLLTNDHQFILPGTQNTYITESVYYTSDAVQLNGYVETPDFPLTPKLLKKLQSLHYTQLRILSKKYASFLTTSQLSGLIDGDGKVVLEPVYDDIFKTSNGCIGFELHRKFGLANPQMQWIFPVIYQYNEILPSIRGEDTFPAFIKLKTGQLWGGVYRSTLQKIEPRYSSITNFVSGKAWAARDNHFFILDSLGMETQVGPEEQCRILSDELMVVDSGGYKMVKNLHNQWITPPGTSFKSIQKGLLLFVEKDGAGYIYDHHGRQVSARRYYDIIDEFGECLLVADSIGRCAVLRVTGEEIYPAEHEYKKGADRGFNSSEILVLFKIPAEYGTEEYRRLKKQNSWFTWPKRYFSTKGICLNRNGQNYKNIYLVSNGLIVFERDTVHGIFDPNGNEIILPSTKITGYSLNGVDLYELSSKYVVISSDVKQMGLMDQQGKVFVEPEYTAFSPVGNEYIAVKKNGKWGLMDAAGSIVIKPILDTILYIRYGYFLAKRSGRWGAIDAKGSWAHWPDYDEIKPHEDGCFLFKKDNLYTYNYDDEAEELLEIALMIPVEEKQYEEFEMGVVPADLPYDLVWSPANGMTLVQKNRKYGYINADKQEVIAPKYNYAENFIHDIAKVGVAGRYGLINKKGVEILPLIYTDFETSYLKKFSTTVISKDGLYGLINRDGMLICPPKYTQIGGQPEVPGLIPVTLNRLKGFIDSSGNEIVPPVYDEITVVENNTFFIVKKGSFYGLLDTAGNEKIPVFFQKIYRFWSQKQCFIVKKEGKFGIVNADNRTLTPVIYDSLTTEFVIFKNNKAGLLDIHFKEMIPCQYDRIDHSYSNKYFLYQSWKKGVADNRTGDHIPPGDWEDIVVSPDRETGYYRIKMGQKWGYIDRFGKIRVPVRFDAISNFKNGVAHVLIEPHQPAFTSTYNYVKRGPYAYTLPYPLDYVINTAGELLPMERENPEPYYYAR